MLRVGTGREEFTPPVGIAHTLWGARTHEVADRIHLPLFATALCLESDGQTVMILDVDVTGFPTPVADDLRAEIASSTGITPAHISIAATHTHSAPVWNAETSNGASADLPGMHLMPAYRNRVRDAVREAAIKAHSALRPVRMAAAYGESEVTMHRRYRTAEGRVVVSKNEGGERDTTLSLVRFDDLDGETVASIVGYGTQPIVLAHQNSSISSDFPGVLKHFIESLVGGTCIFLQGCAGDQIPYDALTGDVRVAEKIGRRLAADAASTLLALEPAPYEESFSHVVESGAPLGLWNRTYLPDSPIKLAVRTVTVALPVRVFEPIESLERKAAQTRLEFLGLDRGRSSPEHFADLHFRARRADMLLGMAKRAQGTASVPIEIRAIRIGDAVFVTAPMELFAATGKAIRQASPFAVTFVGGYTNGTEGYLPLRETFDEGGYEAELACYVSPEAEAVFRDAACALVLDINGS